MLCIAVVVAAAIAVVVAFPAGIAVAVAADVQPGSSSFVTNLNWPAAPEAQPGWGVGRYESQTKT